MMHRTTVGSGTRNCKNNISISMKEKTEHDGVILINKKDAQKYYVAATRAKYSIAFVVDTLPQNVEWLKREELSIGNDKIEVLRYCKTE